MGEALILHHPVDILNPDPMTQPVDPKSRNSARSPEFLLTCVTVCLGVIHAWTGRYAMNPEGMSYLDVGDSFFRRDWTNAINAWWSPLYPWTIGIVLGVFKPSPRFEFPLVHVVNFGIFLVALAAFRFLLHELIRLRRSIASEGETIPDWPLILVAYPLFWWIAFEVETLYDVSPDLAVAACFFAIAGMLVRLAISSTSTNFAMLGLLLAVGYWTKAVLFPIAFVALALTFWWQRSDRRWRQGLALSAVIFLVVSSPLIVLLSKQKGRFTFGDSGRVNFAWNVSPRTQTRNWQGREPGSGTPVHPTRQLLARPPVFEFDGPVAGTYPPWTDPSYWNEGLQGHFQIRAEIDVLRTTIPSEVRLMFRDQPAFVVAVLAFALLGGTAWWIDLARLWPVLVLALTGMAIYLPLLENDRYLGGFVLVLFLLPLWAGQFLSQQKRAVTAISVAVFAVMALSTADYTLRVLTNHYAIPGVGPNSTLEDVTAAEQLWHLGLHPGDKVAVIGDGTGAYWARLAKLRIVAEIMGMNHGSREFWNSPLEVKKDVFRAFAQAHAGNVIAACPAYPPGVPEGWQPLPGTPYCIRPVP